jgi:signal peptidase I
MVDSERDEVLVDLAIESLRQSGKLRFRAQGTSMLPTIRPGSCVAIRKAAPDQICTGDIIFTKTSAGLRLHRVVEIRYQSSGPIFVTRGDNHEHTDRPADVADVLGKLDGICVRTPPMGAFSSQALRMSVVNGDCCPRRAANVAARVFGGEAIVMNPADSTLFNLNPTATAIWLAADGKTTLRHIVERDIVPEFDVKLEVAPSDAGEFVQSLAEQSILILQMNPDAG